jgi:hypothetical protein
VETRFEPEPVRAEPRFHADTVQKAVALAQRLQNERRETLSLGEIDQIAAEIGIDPSILRQALNAIAEKEAREAGAAEAVLGQMTANNHQMTAQNMAMRRQRQGVVVLSTAAMVGFLLLTIVGLRSRSQMAPYPPQPPRMVVAQTELANGGFEAGPAAVTTAPAGSDLIPGWTVTDGPVTYHPRGVAGANSGALELGPRGRVRQLFQTQPGQFYRLTVRVSGVPKNVASMGRVGIVIGGFSTDAAAFTPAKGAGEPQWIEGVLPFRAEESGTTVELSTQNRSGEDGSPVIDSVTLTPTGPNYMPLSP